MNNQLRIDWTFSKSVCLQETIDKLMDNFSDKLQDIINYCLFREEREYTPLDFPKMDFTPEELDDFLSDL